MKTINIYSINELSKEAKQYAIEQYRLKNQGEVFWTEEMLASLKGLFQNCSDIKLKDYSLGEYNSSIDIEFSRDEVADFKGSRAMAWLENNLLSNIRINFYGATRKDLRQYGKAYYAGLIKPCPFTGYCADDDFLFSLIQEVKDGTDLKTAFESLATTYQKLYNQEIEYQNSDEYIAEHLEANDYQFLEDGSRTIR